MRTGIGKLTLLSMQLLTVMMTLMLWTIPTTLHAQEEGDNISREIFIYSPNERAGLHAAYLDIEQRWIEIGQLCASDYGQWGAEKRMYSPCVLRASDGTWRAIWQVNDYSPCFAATYSKDLIVWRPQDYPRLSTKNCLKPIMFEGDDQTFDIFYISGNEKYYLQGDKDFRHFTQPQESSISDVAWGGDTATVDGRLYEGKIFDITQGELIQLLTHHEVMRLDGEMSAERMTDDATHMKDLQPVSATLTVNGSQRKTISDKLIGVFFEDISYAADGGLYAELVQNRDFEYSSRDRKEWSATTAWHSSRPIQINTTHPLSANNPHYAVMETDTLVNEGWDGIADRESGCSYDFSFWVRNIDCKKKQWRVQLVTTNGEVLAEQKLVSKGEGWNQYEALLCTDDGKFHANPANRDIRLRIVSLKKGKAAIDMVSLFPQITFKNRKNGLRNDLAQAIADLKPKFVRFPGGCMSHGQGLDNIYHWHHTVGPLQDRKPDFNIWGYHQTRGLGFFEFFQFCEDIGAEPLPVLAAGVPCQNSAADASGYGGQQGGIPMEDMPAYIEEILHMIEWANGDTVSSPWAKMRAEAGHPAPFNLKYVGIGNEDIISTVFEERYEMICKAIKEKYPQITVCGTVGPFHTPSADYLEGWDFAKKHADIIDMVDEHYYESAGWFLNHQDYYDDYDRHAPKVYLGEWAASTPAKRPNVETALAEAIHLCNVERNGDVVEMTSYAPLLAKDGHHNWNPDMIYFTNNGVRTTPAYETQRLFSVHAGDRYLASHVSADGSISRRIAASVVEDSRTGRHYLRLVNALPVTLTLTITGIDLPATLRYEGFAGEPEDQAVTSQEGTLSGNQLVMPPYSFRVFEW